MLLVVIRENAICRNKKDPYLWALTSPGHGLWTEAKRVEYGVGVTLFVGIHPFPPGVGVR